ncbi:phage minor head protein [Roseibium litorale]|uniref:Phage head morphogenesis domain-containing protein n=1 Tax=Roseibium litorale TaxID=2803841 RepID=A0ABR9CJJ1_9HYPH|nr:phage minor head protein [Roseibium litorale]MBD8890908.1 hypothetical protein [Roseibium litorale]
MPYEFTTKPAPEITAFFEGKALKPAFHYRDVLPEEHAFAFTVAKAVKTEVLTEIRDAVSTAIREGKTLKAFQQELEPALKTLGWWGRKSMVDPKTGETVSAQLGSPRRLKTIYWANTRTARAAGLWERAQRTKRVLPYFIYRLGPSEHHRPQHEARSGTILPVDDPVWDEWFPPNGWGCKCWIRQIGVEEADRLGGISEAPVIDYVEVLNKRTGKTEWVPEGIDPGWNSNPGRARARNLINHFNARIEDAGAGAPEAAKKVISEFWSSRAPEAYAKMKERVHMPAAFAPDIAKRLNAPSALVVVSSDTVAMKAGKHGAVEVAAFGQLQKILEKGTAIDRRKDGKGVNFWLDADGYLWRAALRQSADGFLYIGTMFVSSANLMKAHLAKFGEWK